MKCGLTGSLVLYNNSPSDYVPAIDSFLRSAPDGRLVVMDHSPKALHHPIFLSSSVILVHRPDNPGFGTGHNRAYEIVRKISRFHVLLNPDVRFGAGVLPSLVACLASDEGISSVMPRIVYPDGRIQWLCKLLPTPIDLIFRRFIPVKAIRELINSRYELRGLPADRRLDVPSLSGCFLVIRSSSFERVGGFDERYFMYLEDVDLVRRLGDLGRTVYEPSIEVEHGYAKGSYRNRKLLVHHIISAIRYFNKWGWLFDKTRTQRNRHVLGAIARETGNAK